jgi:hypothetical protein
MTNAVEVLISLGGKQYIVKVDPTIPVGEIRIGHFAALDALAEVAGAPVTNAPAAPAVNGTAAPAPTIIYQTPAKGGYRMTRLRDAECRGMRKWIEQNSKGLKDLERKVLVATFPPNRGGYVNSNKVGVHLNLKPEEVREIRNEVMKRAGILVRGNA